ncbi:MAG: hypothetical protein U0325_11655 [Polyangiales bacterium]
MTALEAYRHSLAGVTPLKADEERALAARWRAGDQRAGQRIIEASLPFVITIAAEYRRWALPGGPSSRAPGLEGRRALRARA